MRESETERDWQRRENPPKATKKEKKKESPTHLPLTENLITIQTHRLASYLYMSYVYCWEYEPLGNKMAGEKVCVSYNT